MFLKGEGLFRLDGAGGQIVGKGDAKVGECLSVDVQARIGDDFISHVAGFHFALELIFQELLRYRGEEPQSDDITMLAFCRPDPEPETTTLSVEAHAARPGRPTNPNQTGDTGQ